MKVGKLSFLSIMKLILTSILTSVVIFLIGIALVSCGEEDTDPKPPTVASFTPAYGLPGSLLTINGTNFSKTASDISVKINGVESTISSATKTQLKVVVPEAATGKVSVTVKGKETTSVVDFEVLKDFPRNGLVGFYPFDGNANDASGNALHGAVTEAIPATDRFGNANHAFSFDGVNDKVVVGNPVALQINTHITIAGWINMDGIPANMRAIITKIFFDPDQGSNPTRGYNLYQNQMGNGTPTLGLAVYSSEVFTSQFVGTSVSSGSWIFITLVIDNLSFKFYQNAAVTHESTQPSTILSDGSKGDLVFGAYGGGFFYDGLLDDVMIYNRALSAQEVQALYQQTVTKY